jgi:hypothetical protein
MRAYLLKEAFQQLWEYSAPAWAGKFLDEWCRQTWTDVFVKRQGRWQAVASQGTLMTQQ